MNTKLLIAASALAIMAGAPAFADTTVKTETTTQDNGALKEDIKKGWENTKEAVSNAADKTSEAASKAYESIKATFIDDTAKSGTSTVTINTQSAASGIIGQPVLNTKGEKIASVKDIILSPDGKAEAIVLADGGFMGIGTKLAAFDYSLVSQRQKDGDVIMPISEETLKKVTPFSYDRADAEKDKTVRVMTADAISVSKLLDGSVLNTRKESVADIDNVSFSNGSASQVIISFDKTLGMGGDKAAMDFSSLKLLRDNDKLDFQLSAKQEANFEAFKKTATN